MSANHKAVLVFSADLKYDLAHRGLSKKFRELFEINSLSSKVTPEADIHIFTVGNNFASRLKIIDQLDVSIHHQNGSTFGERLKNAIETLGDLGYQEIVIIGSDCPELQSKDINAAFEKLALKKIVIGPDHRGGCYLIGFYIQDCCKLWGIHWQVNTDCAQLQQVFGKENAFLLRVKHDIDSLEDIRILANCTNQWGIKARILLQQEQPLKVYPDNFRSSIFLPNDIQRQHWQLPPPLIPNSADHN
jgi:glycosyltransferase A (GT-A) superfamily protein (DUF2064 family)